MKKNNFRIVATAIALSSFFIGSGVAQAATATLVNLRSAENFAVLSKTAISSAGTTITGDIGVSPATFTAVTGFSPIGVPANDTFLTSAQLPGYKIYAAGLFEPTPTSMGVSIGDMALAYAEATTGQTTGVGDFLNIGMGTVTARTLVPGVYTWNSGAPNVTITGDITLNCSSDPDGVFVFQIAGTLDLATNKQIILNGCNASNIFWAVAGTTFLQAGSHFEGTILTGPGTTEITLIAGTPGATINGRLLGEKTIALQAGTSVTRPTATPPTSGPVWEENGTPNGILDLGEHFFQTIQSAINAVTTVSGDTIHVSAGTYNEQVIINKAVSVLGAGAATTFIDGTGVTPVLPGLVNITNETGAVTLNGFTIRNAPASGGTRIAIWAKQADEGPVYSSSMTITHNILVGNGQGVPTDDYGLYSNHNKSNLVFSYNDVSNFGGNALLFELHTGPAEISHNTITVDPGAATAIFSMSYKDGYGNNNDVTGKQWLHHNTINANGGSAIVMASAYGYAHYNELTNGKYTNVEITDNVITNVGDAKKGIQLEVDGDNGGFVNPLITGNTISAKELSPGLGLSRGIRIMGVVTGAQITDNEITGFYRGIFQSDSFSHLVYPTNTQISTNVITGGTYGIDIAGGTATIHLNSIVGNTLFGVNNQTVATIDATNNWWGNASGPGTVGPGTGDKVSTNVTFDPWCVNSTCTTPPPTPPRNSGRPATPATPATPAVPGVSPAIPATPAVPASKVLGASTGPISGCDNRTTGFSIVSGQSCATNSVGQVLGAEKFVFTKLMRQGSKGDEVVGLQNFLNAAGYNSGTADGKFGPKSKAALIKFQIANGLKGDGIIGPLTRAFLNK